MSDALLFRFTVDRFERDEVDYGAAWWLVHHSAISSRDLDEAHASFKRMGAIEEEFAAAFQAEYGFLPDAVTLGSERADHGYPFPRKPRVVDRRTGPLPAPESRAPRVLERVRFPELDIGRHVKANDQAREGPARGWRVFPGPQNFRPTQGTGPA